MILNSSLNNALVALLKASAFCRIKIKQKKVNFKYMEYKMNGSILFYKIHMQ